MARNHIRPGNTMTWTNGTGSDVSSGDPVLIGGMLGIALGDIADGESGEVAITEVWAIRKASVAITQGSDAYWDADGDPVEGANGSGCVTNVATDNVRIGRFVAAAGSGDATAQVKLGAA